MNVGDPEKGTTPLMLAAELGYQRICQMLIDAGALLDATDLAGNTPLHMAAQGYGEQKPIIKTLLERGANPKAINDDGETPAMVAKRLGKEDHFKLLDVEIEAIERGSISEDEVEKPIVNDLLHGFE